MIPNYYLTNGGNRCISSFALVYYSYLNSTENLQRETNDAQYVSILTPILFSGLINLLRWVLATVDNGGCAVVSCSMCNLKKEEDIIHFIGGCSVLG